MKNKYLSLFVLLTASVSSFAQQPAQGNGTIKGKVIEKNSKSNVGFASVAISVNGEIISGDLTDEDGSFTITNLPNKEVELSVEYIGFKTYKNTVNLTNEKTIDLGTISLDADDELLSEVVIQAERSTMEQLVDRKVIRVGKDLSTAGASASEIMNNIPSVNVDQDGNISMRGNQNVRILVDGKPTQLDPKTLLKQIPSNSIDKIELITNPSAKYNPEGMSGMINIVLKKNMQDGFNGSYNGNITFARAPKFNQGIDLNLRKGKVNFFGNYGYTDHRGYNWGLMEQLDDKSSQKFDIVNDNKSHTFKVGFDIYANAKNTFSFYTNQTFSKGVGQVANTLTYPSNPALLQTDQYNGDDTSQIYNAAYKKTFTKPGQSLDFEVNYSKTKQDQSGNFGIAGNSPTKYNDNSNNTVDAVQANLDYVHPFNEKTKLEVGAEYRTTGIDNFYNTTNAVANKTDFTYDVDIASAYATFGSKFDKWGYQLGARVEKYNVNADYTIGSTKDGFKDDYLTVYPSAFLSYTPTQTDFLQVSASRRVDRPNVWQTRPIRDYSTPRVVQVGNPELKPQFTNSIEFNYTKILGVKGSVTLGTYYRMIDSPIERTFYLDTSTPEAIAEKKMVMSYGNFDESTAYGAELSANYKVTKWWDAQPSVEYYFRNQRGIVTVLNPTTSQGELQQREIDNGVFNARLNNNFKITNQLRASLFGFYRGEAKDINGKMNPMYKVDAGVRYSFWENSANLSLRFNDVFNTMKASFVGDAPYRQTGEFTWESQSLYVGFQYMFGTGKNKAVQRKYRDNNEVQKSGGFF
ncbi:TonB-dependent receptor [Flavobacterium sp. xlx-214]|uniref:TonB-dependent receptor domain-containing protein n=1 Tax=unclassified Flavobacterium TaxID=196869 RepID=UPI0013CFA22D|nr:MULTISPECIES: TonB-dependent receptor [unclassified Flavobacterium]MBA5792562.1 TonB-dependent receptor [Flavobacterium sp. xlx-221]QMI83712.1 TonB-dependent receptor [Flavobacterium sp. xlx-214]